MSFFGPTDRFLAEPCPGLRSEPRVSRSQSGNETWDTGHHGWPAGRRGKSAKTRWQWPEGSEAGHERSATQHLIRLLGARIPIQHVDCAAMIRHVWLDSRAHHCARNRRVHGISAFAKDVDHRLRDKRMRAAADFGLAAHDGLWPELG